MLSQTYKYNTSTIQVTQVGFAKKTKCILQVNTDDEKYCLLNFHHASTHLCISICSHTVDVLSSVSETLLKWKSYKAYGVSFCFQYAG